MKFSREDQVIGPLADLPEGQNFEQFQTEWHFNVVVVWTQLFKLTAARIEDFYILPVMKPYLSDVGALNPFDWSE